MVNGALIPSSQTFAKDLDLFDKERHLVYVGPVWTKTKTDSGFGGEKWQELQGLVLDNYCELIPFLRCPF